MPIANARDGNASRYRAFPIDPDPKSRVDAEAPPIGH
jgi:hypothetical protein